jgi:hypothetical protein
MVDLGDLQRMGCVPRASRSQIRGVPLAGGLVLHVSFGGESPIGDCQYHFDASILYLTHGELRSRAPRSEYMQNPKRRFVADPSLIEPCLP